MKTFINVAQMKLAFLTAGQQVETTGYYVAGDGGQARYLIEASQSVDNLGDHDLAGTTVAILQRNNDALLRQFGAKIDGATNDVPSWVAADAAVLADSGVIYVPASILGMAIASAISTVNNVHFEEGAFLLYTGSSEEAALTLGVVTGSTGQKTYRNIAVRRSALSDWSNEANIGVRCLNLFACYVEIMRAERFTIGLLAEGNDHGNVYNKYFIGTLIENKISLELLTADTIAAFGYCNENIFYGGSYTNASDTNTSLDRWGVKITSTRAIKSLPNSNLFHKPSFELINTGSGLAHPILIEYGLSNRFEFCRDESNDAPFMECKNNSQNNLAIPSQSFVGVVANSGQYANNFVEPEPHYIFNRQNSSWQSPALHRIANEFDGAAGVYIPGCSIRNSSNGNQALSHTSITVADEYLDIGPTRGVGVMVETENIKRFVFRRDVVAGRGGRVVVIPYDTDVVQLILDDTFVDGDVNIGTERITMISHPFSNGDEVQLTTDGTLPAGLALATTYYIKSIDSDTIELYSDGDLVNIVDITAAAGGGTHTITIWSHVKGTSAATLTPRTSVGGSYRTSADDDADVFFSLSSDVFFIWVGYMGGSLSAQVKSFGLESVDGGALTVFQGYEDQNSDPFPNDLQNYATAIPVTATAGPNYPAGKRITKYNAAAAAEPGWICTTKGLGGTAVFKAEANVAA